MVKRKRALHICSFKKCQRIRRKHELNCLPLAGTWILNCLLLAGTWIQPPVFGGVGVAHPISFC